MGQGRFEESLLRLDSFMSLSERLAERAFPRERRYVIPPKTLVAQRAQTPAPLPELGTLQIPTLTGDPINMGVSIVTQIPTGGGVLDFLTGAVGQVADAYLQREINRVIGAPVSMPNVRVSNPQYVDFGLPSWGDIAGQAYRFFDDGTPAGPPPGPDNSTGGAMQIPNPPMNPLTGKPYRSYVFDPVRGVWKRCRRRRRKLLTDSDYNALLKIQTLKNTDNVKIALAKGIR